MLLAGLMVLTILLGTVFARHGFLWCPAMQRVVEHDCCARKKAEPSPTGQSVVRPSCCETKVLPPVPDGSSTTTLAVVRPFESRAWVPPSWHWPPSEPPAITTKAHEREARAGPGLRLHELKCVYLI